MSNLIGASGQIGAAGEAGKALAANDATTADARTPKTHAASHLLGGSDALALAQYDPYDLLPYIVPLDVWPTTSIEPTVKRAYFTRFTVRRNRTFKFVRFAITAVGTGEDKIDAGIYKVNGAKLERLGSSGAVKVTTNATGAKALEMTGTVTCEPGVVYFVSTSWETKTGSPTAASLVNTGGFPGDIVGTGTLSNRFQIFKAETFPLPSSVESLTGTNCIWAVPSES